MSFLTETTCEKKQSPEHVHMDQLSHVKRAIRPGEVWIALCWLHRARGLPEDIIKMIHAMVMTLPGEREGYMAFEDRYERQDGARVAAGAESVVKRWQLLGFDSLLEFLDHRRNEEVYFHNNELKEAPMWLQFGFRSEASYKRRLARLRSNQ